MTLKPTLAKRVRPCFPMLNSMVEGTPLVYLDTAATSFKPQAVIDAISEFYSKEYSTVHRSVYTLAIKSTEAYQRARKKIASFINSKSEDQIIFTSGTTAGINLVATSFGKAFVKPKDEVIVTILEHHSNIVPWQMMCEERGAILRVVEADEAGNLNLEQYASLLNEKTAIVAVGHISNAFGTMNPIKKMTEMAHSAGAKILVDGAQAAGHLPLDMQELGVDFYVFSGHKIYGPTGVGILYGREELLEAMPPYQGGGDMIETVTFEKTTYNVLPLKFEAGTPMIAEVIGLGAAIDFLTFIGLEKIYEWERFLLDYATLKLSEIERVKIIGTALQKGAIISFAVEKAHPLDIGTLLDLRGIAIRTGFHCAQPAMRRFGLEHGTSRISFGMYNTIEEIDYTIASLRGCLEILTAE